MAARKLTRDPDGNLVVFSTKRGNPKMCSMTCGSACSFKGELYCKAFGNVVGRRSKECIENEVKQDGRIG